MSQEGFQTKTRNMILHLLESLRNGHVDAHSAADCNGVSGGFSGQGMSHADAFTHVITNTYMHAYLVFWC